MDKKNIFLFFFFLLLIGTIIAPVIADMGYGIRDNSEYIWDVTEEIAGESIQYRLTVKFNLKQNKASMTRYFYSNGSTMQFNMQMNQVQKYIVASHERYGEHNYFYTGPGTLNFPRHTITIEDALSTQVVDYNTGVTLYYSSDLQEHELISGQISITWFVWLILGITISLSVLSIFLIYQRGKKDHKVLVYGNAPGI